MKTVRFLLEDRNKGYKNLIEVLYDNLDLAVPTLVQSKTFEEFIEKATGTKPEISDPRLDLSVKEMPYKIFATGMAHLETDYEIDGFYDYAIIKDSDELIMNETAFQVFTHFHNLLRKEIEGIK